MKPILEFFRPKKRNDQRTHDYTKRGWGHDYTFDPGRGGLEAKMMGWGMGIEPNDYLILAHSDGGTTRYQVKRIEYYQDPPDMWRADVKFAPRQAMTVAQRLKALAERALYPSWTRDELAAIRAEVEAVALEIRRGEHSIERGRDGYTPYQARESWADRLTKGGE